jgi:hypothetical protein
MNNCEELQGYLIDRVLGEVIPREIEVELRDHLSLCPSCRQQFEESETALRSLDGLKDIRFPESISLNVLREAAAKPRAIRFLGYPFTVWRLSALAAAASLLLAAGIYIIFHGDSPVEHSDQPVIIRTASTFVPGEVPMPDLKLTMESYFNETGNILYGIREGSYSTWGLILSEIISRDIQGRANFLLENPNLPHPARPIIGVLHDAFQQMLRSGRGHEKDEVRLPPGINPEALLAEIDKARCEVMIVQ